MESGSYNYPGIYNAPVTDAVAALVTGTINTTDNSVVMTSRSGSVYPRAVMFLTPQPVYLTDPVVISGSLFSGAHNLNVDGHVTASIPGTVNVTGSVLATIANQITASFPDTMTISGSVNVLNPVTSVTASIPGVVIVTGSVFSTVTNPVTVATSSVPYVVTIATSSFPYVVVVSGTVATVVTNPVTASFPSSMTASIPGVVVVTGSVAVTNPVTASFPNVMAVSGAVSVLNPVTSVTASIPGVVAVTGSVVATIANQVSASFPNTMTVSGTVAVSNPVTVVTASISNTVPITGSVFVTNPTQNVTASIPAGTTVTASIPGVVSVTGSVVATIANQVTASFPNTMSVSGSVAVLNPVTSVTASFAPGATISASIAGLVNVTGSVNATLPAGTTLTASIPGFVNVTGSVSANVSGALAMLDGNKQTYSAAAFNVNIGVLSSDLFVIAGSATKTIRVNYIAFSATETVALATNILLIKRSSLNTGGTSAAVPAVPHDSNNAAATATVLAYSGAPSALGTAVGTLRARKTAINVATVNADECVWYFGDRPSQSIVLRGANQCLAINLNNSVFIGGSANVAIEWSEEG